MIARGDFLNNKKTFLEKIDKSKKGNVDARIIPLLNLMNTHEDYYTTSSCSGRVYFWRTKGKKNETEWLNVSHDLIDITFFNLDDKNGFIWLRLEDFIAHIACKDIASANKLLTIARQIYKKSAILSATSKIIVEIRGSEFMDMPFCNDGIMLYNCDLLFLQKILNERLQKIWQRTEKCKEKISRHLFSFHEQQCQRQNQGDENGKG